MELTRQITWSNTEVSVSHYRTKDGQEVDLILHTPRGEVIGIEVKASASVRAEDFRGMRHLKDKIGSNLLAGIILYTGSVTASFGNGMRALPISALWQTGR